MGFLRDREINSITTLMRYGSSPTPRGVRKKIAQQRDKKNSSKTRQTQRHKKRMRYRESFCIYRKQDCQVLFDF